MRKSKFSPQQIASILRGSILTYDYRVKNGVLVYTYWTGKGKNIKTTDISIKSIDTISISLIDNQLFYKNKQLTFARITNLNLLLSMANRYFV